MTDSGRWWSRTSTWWAVPWSESTNTPIWKTNSPDSSHVDGSTPSAWLWLKFITTVSILKRERKYKNSKCSTNWKNGTWSWPTTLECSVSLTTKAHKKTKLTLSSWAQWNSKNDHFIHLLLINFRWKPNLLPTVLTFNLFASFYELKYF